MTLFILDPNLDTQHGHHLNWDLSIAREAVDRGEDVTIYANRVFAAAVPDTVTVVPYFSHSTYLRRSQDRITGRFDDFRHFNDILAEELEALPRGMFAATDVVLVPTLSENHCLAYVAWAKQFDPVSAPLFVVHLMFPSGVVPTGAPGGYTVADPLQALFYRLAFDVADKPGGAPIYFFGGGRQIAREFSCLSGRTIEPHPVPIRPERRRPLSREGRPVALLYAGDAKIEKGIHLLPELAARLCAAHPEWDFTAHVNSSTSWGEALQACEALRQSVESLANFRLYQGHLSPEAYLDFLEEARCLLCTYDPEVYARKSSGVIWECISLGIPMLVPAGCWLEKEAEEWRAGYLSFRPYDLDAMCGEFGRFAAKLGALETTSAEAARQYQSFNGAAAIIDQIAPLSVPRFMAASLGGRQIESLLPLDEIDTPGWHGIETVDSRLARWTAKEAQLRIRWAYPEPWAVELYVDALADDDQLTQAEARVGDVRLATTAFIDGNGSGRLVVKGSPREPGTDEQLLAVSFPNAHRPTDDARDLGVRVRRVLLKPATSDALTPVMQGNRIAVRSAVKAGPAAGSFVLQGTVSGIFWLEPHAAGEIRFRLSSTAGPELRRRLKFYIDGEPAAMSIEADGTDEWRACVLAASRGRERPELSADWDLVVDNSAVEDEIIVHDLGIAAARDPATHRAWTTPGDRLPLRMDAASRMLDETGFHRLERDGSGTPFRWTRSEARFHFVIDRSAPIRFRARFGGVQVKGAAASVLCFDNGAPIAMEVNATQNNFELSGALPVRSTAGGTTLSLLFPVASPAETGSLDSRVLGAAFYWLEIEKAA
jgi:hypothetical protein